jgi:hypothetical protein
MAPRKPPSTAQATSVVRSHAELAAALENGDVIVVEPEGGRGMGDRVIVGIYDHERGRSLVALVDADGVVGVHETPASFQLSERERETAEELAAADDRVRSFLRRRRMNPLTRLYFPPGDATKHRHAIVFLRPTSSERRYAVVDLTDKRVVGVLGEADLTRGVGS